MRSRGSTAFHWGWLVLVLSLVLVGCTQSPGQFSSTLGGTFLHAFQDVGRQVIWYGGRGLWLLFLSALLYLLPGGAAVAWLLRDEDWIDRLIVAAGVSVAINIMLVYASLAGLRLSRAVVIGYLVLCVGLIAARWVLLRRRIPISLSSWLTERLTRLYREPADLTLAVVVLLVLGARIWVMRDIVAPRWGDSYQHAVITQLLVDQGGVFESWEPYAPYVGLTAHWGFHSNAALFHWISGVGAARSVLWTGQIMNVLACLALYPLGKRAGGRWAGVVAVLVSGLLATTPMIYVNWGRYPQLTGQVLLPVAAWLLWVALDRPKTDWRLLLLTSLPAAGQFLAYYRMPYFIAPLVGALVLCVYLPAYKLQWRRWGSLVLRIAAVGVMVALILLPWMAHISQGRLATTVSQGVVRGQDVDLVRAEYEQWRALGVYVSRPLLVVAGIAFLWALVRRETKAIAVGVWGIGLYLLVATRLVGLPGASLLNAFACMIFVYAPVSLLIGWLGAQVVRWVGAHWTKWGQPVCGAAMVALAFLGAYRILAVSDPGFDLVKPADLRAMAWIQANTPQDSRFLVNGFLVYDGYSAVGSDAGWWIPLLTGRANTMPPQYALFNEREIEPGYGRRVVNLVADLRRTPLSTPEGLGAACQEGITHVYIGQVEGRVGVPPPEPLFTAQEMLDNPAFEVLYHQDSVWIFALTDVACRT